MVSRDELLRRLPWAVRRHRLPDPEQVALLVIDMQEYFRDLAEPILPAVLSTIEACRRMGVPVVFTQHVQERDRQRAGMLAEWWGDLIVEGSPESALLTELRPHVGARGPVLKRRYDAFWKTDLETRLQELGRREVAIAGVMTHLCCETTARAAFVRDYRVFFLIDGTATDDLEHHWASLRNLIDGFTYWLTCDELTQCVSG